MEFKNKADLFTYLEELETKLSQMQETIDTQKPADEDKKDGKDKKDGEELSDEELNDLDNFFEEEL